MVEVTNYIDRLVAELCPDGVEYRPLGEICAIRAGGDLPESYVKGQKEPSDLYPYPIYSNGSEEKALYGYASTYRTEGPAVTVSARGTIGYHAVRYGKFTPIVRLITLKPSVENLDIKFLDYCLDVIDISHSGGSIPQLTVPNLKKMEIPVPPMDVQEAIVEILDKFTNMEAELEAELEARTLQYEYYRGSLFGTLKDPATSLPAIAGLVKTLCPDGVEYRSLKDVVAKNYGGGTPRKSKAEYWDGNIPWASVGDLSDDVLEVTDTRSKITEEGVKGSSTNIVPAGAVIVAIKINPGRMKIAGMNLAINQDIRGLVLNDSMNARFLTYYFRTLMFAGHGTIVKSITNKHLMETKIPVPPMEIQQRIVDILDRFDALTTSLSEGLPAELAARRSQYEYYRDQLLSFPRKGENQ